MPQVYHSNAVTNVAIRTQIKNSNENYCELAAHYQTSENTIAKWKNRAEMTDKSSRPDTIKYALNPLQKALIVSIRKESSLSLDLIVDSMQKQYPQISRSSVYRTLKAEKCNTIPEEKKENAKTFKQYEPGYLHIDVTYLPKFEGVASYLFVAIDRATRLLFYQIYEHKTAENSVKFMEACIAFFPMVISHVLTDNGLEFTNALIRSKTGNLCTKASQLDVVCQQHNIDHRLTKPAHPQTNGMVERVNGTIKNSTVLVNDYSDIKEMNKDLKAFLYYYILYRPHGSLKKELRVKTPMEALENWYKLKPELFTQTPQDLKDKILILQQENKK